MEVWTLDTFTDLILLGKQGWNLQTNQDIMIYKVFKAK